MVRILTDVHLTEAAVSYLKGKGEQRDISPAYYDAVLSRHKISRKCFESNFNYYNRNQEDLLKIYDEVIKNLEILKKQGQTREE
jgi:hypothetical protein